MEAGPKMTDQDEGTRQAEAFNLSDTEYELEWLASLPDIERDVSAYFYRIFSPCFELIQEVPVRTECGDTLRVDYVGREHAGDLNGGII